MYSWLKFLHIIGTFGFLVAHGVSINAGFKLRSERNLERIRALLDLSSGTLGMLHGSILLLLVTGIINGFIGHWWGKAWIWVSLVLLIAIYVYMGIAASRYYARVRKAAGLQYMDGMKPHPPEEQPDTLGLDSLLKQPVAIQLAGVGFLGLLVIVWLMIFKPF